jgi:hypothetical protein
MSVVAHRDNSVPRSNSTAFGADRTSNGSQDRLDLSRMTLCRRVDRQVHPLQRPLIYIKVKQLAALRLF